MACIGFLDLPITIRNQIYAEILIPEKIPDTKIYWNVDKSILFTNRQIYEESSEIFYSKNLFVVIETNDPSLIVDVPDENVSIFAKNPVNVANCKRMAMTVEMYMFDNRLPTTSSPQFVLTAASLPDLFHELWMPKLYIWAMQCSLGIQLKERFSYSQEILEKLLIDPLIGGFLAPTFAGISSLDPTISDINISAFPKRFIGKYDPKGNMAKLRSLMHGAVQNAGAQKWEEAANIYGMCIRYAKMLWACHLKSLQEHSPDDFQMVLWTLTADCFADRTISIWQKAKRSDPINVDNLQAMREVAEEGILFLNEHDPWIEGGPDEKSIRLVHPFVEKRKAKVSFRAQMACHESGDRDAAVEYLKECLKYEPETEEKLRKRIETLEGEEQRIVGRRAVLWKELAAVSFGEVSVVG